MIRMANPNVKVASGGRELIMRCIFCGDSDNPRHAHLYIKVPQTRDELSFYDCKKCNSHGMVTDTLLRRIGCTDTQAIVEFLKHNAEVMASPKYKTLKMIDIYPLNWSAIRNTDVNEFKLQYIWSRIGWNNFSYNDAVRLKIFLNLYDIVQVNRLELTRNQYITDALDRNFIGFISYDNSFANMRQCIEEGTPQNINKRYINYDLIQKPEDSKNYYVIPTKIDVLNPTPVKIHIAEGPFDILSIFYNMNSCMDQQAIYIACGGKSYSQAIEFILTETGIVNYEIHLYPDADVNDWFVNTRILNNLKGFQTTVYIHRNGYPGEKDYGVPKERIVDRVAIYTPQ